MNLYRLARPLVFALDAERAHHLAIAALKRRAPRAPAPDDPVLATAAFGIDFANPIGIAAGFDKHGEAPVQLAALGFGFVEIGSVTPRPQPGNPLPRVFRLTEDAAVINRYGFNSAGADAARANLERARAQAPGLFAAVPLGINLGKNKETPDEQAADDFARAAEVLGGFGRYVVVNVSSPNTPGLRALQGRGELAAILARVAKAVEGSPLRKPLLVKIAPDLAEADLGDVAALALDGACDGVIVSNTTIRRPESLKSRHRGEAGGLSGAPLKPFALETLRIMYRLTQGRVPLIGVGGIASGADAYERIRAGASLVQIYSALVFEGPGLIGRIKRDLAVLLRRDRCATIADAVGADQR